jgi:hypothetical protein
VKLLLDENFPLQLWRRLRDVGHDVEHLITSGQRGLPDAAIRERLNHEDDLVLLTQDTDFEELGASSRGRVIISRVPQGIPIAKRVDLWLRALEPFLEQPPSGRLFDLLADGDIVPVEPRG